MEINIGNGYWIAVLKHVVSGSWHRSIPPDRTYFIETREFDVSTYRDQGVDHYRISWGLVLESEQIW
jgi:hypothetical protein